MMDNALNMDTFVEAIQQLAEAVNISFNVTWACLCCMPHTVHLSAIEVSDQFNDGIYVNN